VPFISRIWQAKQNREIEMREHRHGTAATSNVIICVFDSLNCRNKRRQNNFACEFAKF